MATPARPQIDTGYFFEQIQQAECSTLVLDFDTTLRLACSPQSTFPAPTVPDLLDCIAMARRTRVVVASTQAARDVLKQIRPPYPEIWGRNGLERIPAGTTNFAAAVSFCIHPRQKTEGFSNLLVNLSTAGPVAYVVGQRRGAAGTERLYVCPQLHLGGSSVSLSVAEDLVQFLADWLRACAGEIC